MKRTGITLLLIGMLRFAHNWRATWDFQGGAVVKNLPANTGEPRDTGSIAGSGRSPGVGNGSPLQYSCLGDFMDRGAWRAPVHGAAKSQT